MTDRYIVEATSDHGAILWDTLKQEAVLTGSGAVYEAPIDNVRWTALTMNKALAETPETPVLADSMTKPAPKPTVRVIPMTLTEWNQAGTSETPVVADVQPGDEIEDQDTGEVLLVQTAPDGSMVAVNHGTDSSLDGTERVVPIVSPDALADVKPRPVASYQPRHGTNPEFANLVRMAAYRQGARAAERRIQEALALLTDRDSNVLHIKLESALTALTIAREVAEDENPYL